MSFVRHRLRSLALVGPICLGIALLISACGASTKSSPSTGTHRAASHAASGGNVNVLYAASLEVLMNSKVGSAFHASTGYSFEGFPAGSSDLASEIKGKVQPGDVFLSAAPAVNQTLEGSKNGNWVSWYAPIAQTRLVIGYNPHSRFAHALRTEPWYKVITQSGFRLGFTDPKLDPKGVLAVAALRAAAKRYHMPALQQIASDQSDLYPEQDLVGRLQSGQLDAGFFYTVEASAAHFPTVSLGSIRETATYTITVLQRADNQAGADAFVRFLLGATGRKAMKSAGLSVIATPKAVGQGVPTSLRRLIRTHT